MKKLIPCGLAAISIALAVPVAHSASIGVNFVNPNQGVLAASDSAGVPAFAQTNYNNVSSPFNLVLNNNSGTATTAQLSISNAGVGGYYTPNTSGPDEILNNEEAYSTGGTLESFTVSSIPFTSYSILVYDLSAVTGAVQAVTLGNTTFYTSSPNPTAAGYIDNNSGTAFTYTRGTSTNASAPTALADYVLFTGLSGSTQTVATNCIAGSGNAFVGGFQIIDTSVVPEPSTWAMLGLGVAGLGVVTLRRRA